MCAQTFNGENNTPKSRLGKLWTLVVSISLTICLSAYTANLATFLMSKAKEIAHVNDLSDLLENGWDACSMDIQKTTINSVFPNLGLKTFASFSNLLAAAKGAKPECKAIISDAATVSMWFSDKASTPLPSCKCVTM